MTELTGVLSAHPQAKALAALQDSPFVVRYLSAWTEPRWGDLSHLVLGAISRTGSPVGSAQVSFTTKKGAPRVIPLGLLGAEAPTSQAASPADKASASHEALSSNSLRIPSALQHRAAALSSASSSPEENTAAAGAGSSVAARSLEGGAVGDSPELESENQVLVSLQKIFAVH